MEYELKLDQNTLNTLKNFSKISPSIAIDQGSFLKSINASKTIFGWAEVQAVFPQSFAIFDLNRFIATLSLFKEPELTFEDRYVVVSDDTIGKKVKYVYADAKLVPQTPAKKITIQSPLVTVTLTNDVFKSVEKAHSVLGLPNILISGDGTSVSIQCADVKNSTGDNYSYKIGETDKTFNVIFNYDNLKIISADYDVTIAKGISHFVTKDKTLEYFIAVEDKSTYG